MIKLMVFLIILLSSELVSASVMVSPVIIDEPSAKAGQTFHITVSNFSLEDKELSLDYALFDQDKDGQLKVLDNQQESDIVQKLIGVPSEQFIVQAEQEKVIPIELKHNQFKSVYFVVFINFVGENITSRIGVLFLLTTQSNSSGSLAATLLQSDANEKIIKITNFAKSHQRLTGKIKLYCAKQKELIEKEIDLWILPNRIRLVKINQSSDAEFLEIVASNLQKIFLVSKE